MVIGLVAEGVTELPILQNVILGFTGDGDLVIDQLSPLRDESHKPENLGGWSKVFEYCRSAVFRGAFQQQDFVIIHIDTDMCEEYGVRRSHQDGKEQAPAELIEATKAAIIEAIGREFYEVVAERIIFAITVDSIECWLLPLYYTDNRAKKYKNCVDTLNQKLRADGYTIDHKNDRMYEKLSKDFKKKNQLNRAAQMQESLGRFLIELEKLNPGN